MMFSSLRSRLWLTYVLLATMALGVVALIYFVYLIRNPLLNRQALGRINTIESYLIGQQSQWAGLPLAQIRDEFLRNDRAFDTRLLLLDVQNNILVDTRSDSLPPLRLRRFARLFFVQTMRDDNGDVWLYTSGQLPDGRTLVVTVPRPKVSILAVLTDELLPPLLQGGALALLMALVFAYFMARWVADPLQAMVNAAASFPAGNVKPLPLAGPREVQDVLSAFNQMTTRVQASQRSQRDFVANVSHELKTPLTSIQGFSQALLDGTASTQADQQQAARVIYAESGRMYRMVLDLLDLARLDSGMIQLQRATVSLPELLRGVVERFRPQSQRSGVELVLESADAPSLIGDGDRLAQVFNNLVDNALKFTPSGGKIRLSIRPVADKLEVDVADTGIGMPADRLEHIFDRFYQVDSSRQGGEQHGAGLGLAIAHEIIRMHGGKISVRSAPQAGTVFTVSLPLLDSDSSTIARRKKTFA